MAVQIEERLFAEDDPDFLRRVQVVKDALFQWEAAGRLSPLQSKALAEQCQRSPQLAAELAEVRARAARTAGRIALVPAARVSARRSSPSPTARSPWKAGLGFAAAAVLALVAGGLLRSHQPARPAAAATTQSTPAQPATSQPAAAATVLFLPAGVLRGPEAAKPLPLPDPARPVDLQIELRTLSTTQSATWLATLTRGPRTLLTAQAAPLKSEGSIHYLSLAIPAHTLTPGDYRLTLTPPTAPSTPIDRTFTVSEK